MVDEITSQGADNTEEHSYFTDNIHDLIDSSEDLNQILSSFTDLMPLSELEDKLTAREYSLFHTTISYVLCSLFFAYLKLNGHDAKNHPIKLELDSIQTSMKKLANLDPNKPRPAKQIDRGAAKRFINFYTSNPKRHQSETGAPKHIFFEDDN